MASEWRTILNCLRRYLRRRMPTDVATSWTMTIHLRYCSIPAIVTSDNWTLSRRESPDSRPRPASSGRVTDSIHLDSKVPNRPNPTANPHHQPDADDDGDDDVAVGDVVGDVVDDVVVGDERYADDADGRRRRHRRRCHDVESIHFPPRRQCRRLDRLADCCPATAGSLHHDGGQLAVNPADRCCCLRVERTTDRLNRNCHFAVRWLVELPMDCYPLAIRRECVANVVGDGTTNKRISPPGHPLPLSEEEVPPEVNEALEFQVNEIQAKLEVDDVATDANVVVGDCH